MPSLQFWPPLQAASTAQARSVHTHCPLATHSPGGADSKARSCPRSPAGHGALLVVHIPSEASAPASSSFSGSCHLLTGQLDSPKSIPTSWALSLPHSQAHFSPLAFHQGPLCSRTSRGSPPPGLPGPMAGPASYPARMSRAGRGHVLCCIIEGNDKAQREEEIHSLVSDRVWIRTWINGHIQGRFSLSPVLWATHTFSCCYTAKVPLPCHHSSAPSPPPPGSPPLQLPCLTSQLSHLCHAIQP